MKNALNKNWLHIALLLLPFIVLVVLWPQLPNVVPMHWNAHGQVDRWGPKWTLLLLPLINLAGWLLLHAVPYFDPRIRRAPEQHERTLHFLRMTQLAHVTLLTLLSLLVIAAAAGGELNVTRIVLIAVLALLVVLGNFLPSVKQNYFIGIRTPWTLDEPRTWQATHRLGGRLICFGALLLLLLQAVLPVNVAFTAFTFCLLGFAVWAFVYSFMHSRRLHSTDEHARSG